MIQKLYWTLIIVSVTWTTNTQSSDYIPRHAYHELDHNPVAPKLMQTIESLRTLIWDKIESSTSSRNKKNAGTLIRAVFHDCGNCYVADMPDTAPQGCCDGCVDYSKRANVGLEQRAFEGYSMRDTIERQGLKQWYQEWIDSCPGKTETENYCYHWTRADVMAAVGNIAIEYTIEQIGGIDAINAKEINEPALAYPPYHFGRQDCETGVTFANPVRDQGINPGFGIDEFFPDDQADLWSDLVPNLFEKQFGLTEPEAVALFTGGHNLGRAHDRRDFDSGFRDRWNYRSSEFDQGYVHELLKRSWSVEKDDEGNVISPVQYVRDKDEQRMMLNVDISMVYDVDHHFDSDSNQVTCDIMGIRERQERTETPPQVHLPGNICNFTRNGMQVYSYTNSRMLSGENAEINAHYRFVRDFLGAWDKMTRNGYDNLYTIDANSTMFPMSDQE